MRGTAFRIKYMPGLSRITPAHAGNSLPFCGGTFNNGDHPRTCGEQFQLRPLSRTLSGSPPHMRGTDSSMFLMVFGNRITPAHAGNRFQRPELGVQDQDHPRTCGEQLSSFLKTWLRPGSPPHMRGTVEPLFTAITDIRITPAHAGNSAYCSAPHSLSSDHPRTCGEQIF